MVTHSKRRRGRSQLLHAWLIAGVAVFGVGLASCVRPGAQADANTPADEQPSEQSTASKLDQLLDQHWARAGVKPAKAADDAEFMRRVTLDLVGRVPTEAEAEEFLKRTSGRGKRLHLVHNLIESPEFAEHWADVYADLMIGLEPGGQSRRLHASFRGWWAEQLQNRVPYNRMVQELLTVEGEYPVADAGPATFLFRHGKKNRIEGVTTEATRLLLGVQIGCAQCHDHPYDDRYKQSDFYAMGAFFAQSRARNKKSPEGRMVRVFDRPRGEARIPNADGTPGPVVAPKFLGRAVANDPQKTRREQLAGEMLNSELLAKTLVNRTWAQFFGRGLVEPWDDLGGEGDASHPPILNYLAQQFQQRGYDFQWLVEEIVLSKAYQRTSAGAENLEAQRAFAQAAVRPLTPRQLFRSLIVATGLETSQRRDIQRLVEARREQVLREYLFVFADDEAAEVESFSGNVPQALLLLNGDLGNRGVTVGASPTLDRALGFYADNKPEVARKQAIETLVLAAYGRLPSAEEQMAHERYLADAADSPAAFEDLLFSLLLASEFQTNH